MVFQTASLAVKRLFVVFAVQEAFQSVATGRMTQFAQGFGFDLADAFGRYAVFGSQFVQGQTAIILQPAAFNNTAAAVVQLRQGVLQTFGLQGVVGLFGQLTARLCIVVGQPVNRDEVCLLYTSPSPRDGATSRMPSSA